MRLLKLLTFLSVFNLAACASAFGFGRRHAPDMVICLMDQERLTLDCSDDRTIEIKDVPKDQMYSCIDSDELQKFLVYVSLKCSGKGGGQD